MFFNSLRDRGVASFLYRGTVILVLGVGLLIPLLVGILFKWHHGPEFFLNPQVPFWAWVLAVVAAVTPFVLVAMIGVVRREPSRTGVLLAFFGLLMSRAMVTVLLDNQLISDYATMWRFIHEFLASPAVGAVDGMPQLRTFPFYLPAARLLGTENWVYQFANIVAEAISAGLLYSIAFRFGGRRAGLIALILFAFAPEPLFAVEILTHDIPGTMYVLIAIYLAIRVGELHAYGSMAAAVPGAVLLGIVLVLLNLQRNLSMLMFAAIFLSWLGVVSSSKVRASGSGTAADHRGHRPGALAYLAGFLLLVAIPFATFQAGSRVAEGLLYSDAFYAGAAEWNASWMTFHAHTGSQGVYADGFEIMPHLQLLTPAGRVGLLTSRSLSDLHRNVTRWPRAYAGKTMRLYNIGRQGGEYFGFPSGAGLTAAWDQEVLSGTLYLYTLVYALLFLASGVVVVLWLMMLGTVGALGLLPALFVALLTIALGVFGEIQSRYIFPLWGVLAIYIGILVGGGRSVCLDQGGVLRSFAAAGMVGLAGLVSGAMAFGVFHSVYGHSRGKMIVGSEWQGGEPIETHTMSGVRLASGDGVPVQVKASIAFDADRNSILSLFVAASGEGTDACTWQANIGAGGSRWTGAVLLEPKRPVLLELSIPSGRTAMLTVSLGSDSAPAPAAGATRCTAVDFLFPRLVPKSSVVGFTEQSPRLTGARSAFRRSDDAGVSGGNQYPPGER